MNVKSLQMGKHHQQAGFTLIELMLGLVVIAVLTAISVPIYTKYVVKGTRTALQSEMTQVAQKLANYKMVNHNYNVSLTAVGGSASYPTQGTPTYDLVLDTATVPGGWTLTATPKTGTKQAGDGAVRINDQGWQCWTKTTTPCVLSATSKW